MKKELNEKDYNNYMKVVSENIKETERRLETLEKSKRRGLITKIYKWT